MLERSEEWTHTLLDMKMYRPGSKDRENLPIDDLRSLKLRSIHEMNIRNTFMNGKSQKLQSSLTSPTKSPSLNQRKNKKLIKWNDNLAQLQKSNDLLNQKKVKKIISHHQEEIEVAKGILDAHQTYQLSYTENDAPKQDKKQQIYITSILKTSVHYKKNYT